MKPPICAVCYRDQRDNRDVEFKLVGFRRGPADEEWHRRSLEEGFVGHPPDVEWFCAQHVDAACQLTGMTRNQALAALGGSNSAQEDGRPR